ncbi:glycosyltransferase family 4 protein [Pontibacter sp. 172403-2]|uniref:glycosyltransferase family 4 protein n=1 Tax=Pontibacter rufus TaxID=2791028 RepID=UPI0018AFB5DD|nr:glycosyltransferase family 4 protein [Pontibacter sp. 172403-2]MBF9253835.1 glycosyltransferase family 4 protein [Pontibacter sp. 172403-2]
MKILFITTAGSPWGGSEELWSQAAVRLVHKGYKIAASIGYYGTVHPKIKRLIDEGVIIKYRKSTYRDTLCQALDKFQLISYRGFIKNSYEEHIYQEKPDMVVFSQATCFGAYNLMLYCKNKKISYCSISQLNTEYGWPTDTNVDDIAEAFKSAKAAFFVSNSNLKLFQTQIAEKLNNAIVIPNPFNLNSVPELNWPNEDIINIAHVARLDFTHKGTDILLKCFAEKQWEQRKFKLNIYGMGNTKLAKKLAAYCGTHNINFKGHVSNVTDIWNQNHLLVLTSRYEGMPLSLIEAMYCGRTAVVTDVAGHSELVKDGLNGFVAEAATQEHFSRALESAWERKKQWESLGIIAKRTIKDIYSDDPVNIFITKLIEVIHH